MKTIIEQIDWAQVSADMQQQGYAHVSEVLTPEQCSALISAYESPGGYRKTVVMARHRFGLGEYKYYDYPLPDLIEQLRTQVYPQLVPIANGWMEQLGLAVSFPATLAELQQQCQQHGQTKATALILKYGIGGFNTLHQDLYGEVYFPLQLVLFLNEPDVDYTGGEFVLTEQVPRAQSRAIVLRPRRGDLLIITTNFRPVAGVHGYYRTAMRHGVSTLHSGTRHSLGIIFHDAVS
jgi:hypothetical protein